VLLVSTMAGFCVLVVAGGGWALTVLYGSEFAGYGHIAATLALAQGVWAAGLAATHGLRTLERPDIPFQASTVSLGMTFVVAMALIAPLGLAAVAAALLMGRIAELTIRGVLFRRIVAHVY
jgi:O-antigen/teichoic acid export membrane protein